MNFKGPAKPKSPDSVARAAKSLGVECAALAAIVEVETGNSGYDGQGRPKALFEPHLFYKALSHRPELRSAAIRAGLAYARQGEKPYPRDSYPRILKALQIDATATLQATSWGLPQILGSNCKLAGYATATDMVQAFCESEDAQIEALAAFLKSSGLVPAIKARDWDRIARVYNGPAYARKNYHKKLAAAYARAAGKGDIGEHDIDGTLKNVQRLLVDRGYVVGTLDGLWGPMTRRALASFKSDWNATQTEARLQADDTYGDDVLAALVKWPGKPVAPARACATAADIRGSRIVQSSFKNKTLSCLIGLPGLAWAGVTGAIDKFPAAAQQIAPVQAFIEGIPAWIWGLCVFAIAAGIWWQSQAAQAARLDMHRSGKSD